MKFKTLIADLMIKAAELTAEKSAGKASTWTKSQPKEPKDIQEWFEKRRSETGK